jgi:hypothetical protein
MNLELAAQQVCALFHAADAQAFSSPHIMLIESDAFVGHRYM